MSLQRLREWMESNRVAAACVTDPTSIAYLTGFYANPHERLLALAVAPVRAVLLVPDLERENAEGRARGVEIVSWQDGQDPFRVLQSALFKGGTSPLSAVLGAASARPAPLDPGLLAVEKEHLTIARWERLDAGQIEDCSEALRAMRAVKQPGELELLQRAAELTDEVTRVILGELRAGQTEREVATRLNALINETGSGLAFGSLVQSGPNSALPHLPPGERALAAGDLVLLDFGARHGGYNGDTTRMAVVGTPDERQLQVHQAVLDAHDRAIEAIRAGATCGAVDAAARQSLEKAGYGDRFIHRTGHGLGLDAHEGPNLEPGSPVVLEAGNVVTVEPGVYIPGWGGVRIEDDVVVEEGGARLLTRADRSLSIVPT
jgi:Xaa-Pro dipeptidase